MSTKQAIGALKYIKEQDYEAVAFDSGNGYFIAGLNDVLIMDKSEAEVVAAALNLAVRVRKMTRAADRLVNSLSEFSDAAKETTQ